MHARIVSTIALSLALTARATPPQFQSPLATKPIVSVQGTIERVQLSRGEGMPYLEVNDGKKTVRVYLGSIRYLIEQDFNPKAGQTATISAYQFEDSMIAATVTLSGENRTLRLRDEQGFPMWRGGQRKGPPKR